jgi:hypothetical protein
MRYSNWLETLVMDELYYSAAVIVLSINAFGLGLLIGKLMML